MFPVYLLLGSSLGFVGPSLPLSRVRLGVGVLTWGVRVPRSVLRVVVVGGFPVGTDLVVPFQWITSVSCPTLPHSTPRGVGTVGGRRFEMGNLDRGKTSGGVGRGR